MKVVECPECGGFVPLDYERCQNCGHWMKGEASRRPVQQTPYRENKFQRDLQNPRKVAFFVICVIVAIALFSVAIFFALGGAKGPAEIRFEVTATGESTYTFSYLDGNGIHQSQDTMTGSYHMSVKGAASANLIVSCDTSVTAKAYINGKLVDQQSGTYVLLSATP